jgi:hypothetical protein
MIAVNLEALLQFLLSLVALSIRVGISVIRVSTYKVSNIKSPLDGVFPKIIPRPPLDK